MTPPANTPPRLDVWLAERQGITRHAARTLIDAGMVRIGDRIARAGQRVQDRDQQRIAVLAAQTPAEAVSSDLPLPELNIVYEDAWLAVIDKPAGVVVHRGAGHRGGTLADALMARGTAWSLLGGAERPGIVHRLDRDTSGLLVVAKSEVAHRSLAQQLHDRSLGRVYWALVHGGFREDSGTIDAPIGRDPRDRKRMAIVDGGRQAITDFSVRERIGEISRLEIALRSGRTHQIRVHCAFVRHPVLGDAVYGRRDSDLGRPALHAQRLRFVHPVTAERCQFESQLPPELQAALQRARDAVR